jgi:hypothetical protein
MTIGEELREERRRRRRAGDPRLTDTDREFLGRFVDGDLAGDSRPLSTPSAPPTRSWAESNPTRTESQARRDRG